MTTPHIDQVRAALMSTLDDLRDKENPMEIDRARAIAEVAGKLVDTARVEVDFLKATNRVTSEFLGEKPKPLPAGITTSHINRLM